MLENAVRICEAKFGILFRFDEGEAFRIAAMHSRHAAGIRRISMTARTVSSRDRALAWIALSRTKQVSPHRRLCAPIRCYEQRDR